MRPTAAAAGASPLLAAVPDAPTDAPPPVAPPVDPQYGADVNAATLNRDTTLSQDAADRAALGGIYGLALDASGNVIDDHTNPFSRAAAQQTAYDNAVRGTTNSMAARGQLYSGALQNEQNWNAQQNLKGRDALVREFMGRNTALNRADTAAINAYSSAVGSAGAARAQYALDHPPPPPVAADPTISPAALAAAKAILKPATGPKTVRRSWTGASF